MMENTLVYHGAHAPIEELLDHAIKNPVRLDARDVEVVEAARAVEGEVWSPQPVSYTHLDVYKRQPFSQLH